MNVRRAGIVVLVGVLAVAVAATVAVATAAPGGTKVGLRATAMGRVLAGPNGHTLYLFRADKRSTSTCYRACAVTWPPLLSKGAPIALRGIRQRLLGTLKRKDGTLQVTYNRHPLYYFRGDKRAGQSNGAGLNNAWYPLSAQGRRVPVTRAVQPPPPSVPADPAPPPSAPPSSDDPGYGYGP